jgi:non-ribosomal peptide synthetase component F
MVVGLLAILKAGVCYVPLDPEYPAERLGYMLKDSAPSIILTHVAARVSLQAALESSGITARIVYLDVDSADWMTCSARNPSPAAIGLTSRHLAYIIYTSGSTGQPKGVMVEHGGVSNRLFWMQTAYTIDCSDAVLCPPSAPMRQKRGFS